MHSVSRVAFSTVDTQACRTCFLMRFNMRFISTFLDYRDYDTEQIIYAYLKQIDRTRLFYINVYHLASKNASRHICQDISNAFFKEMQTHLFNSDYSNNHIKGFTSVLFSHVTDWLAHGHKKNALDIYNEVRFMLPSNA